MLAAAALPALAAEPPDSVTDDRGFVTDGSITFYEGSETQLVLPPSGIEATSVGPYSFMDLEDLTWLCLRGDILVVGERAFAGCTRLETALLLEGVQSIGAGAFSRCTSLKSVYLQTGQQMSRSRSICWIWLRKPVVVYEELFQKSTGSRTGCFSRAGTAAPDWQVPSGHVPDHLQLRSP